MGTYSTTTHRLRHSAVVKRRPMPNSQTVTQSETRKKQNNCKASGHPHADKQNHNYCHVCHQKKRRGRPKRRSYHPPNPPKKMNHEPRKLSGASPIFSLSYWRCWEGPLGSIVTSISPFTDRCVIIQHTTGRMGVVGVNRPGSNAHTIEGPPPLRDQFLLSLSLCYLWSKRVLLDPRERDKKKGAPCTVHYILCV